MIFTRLRSLVDRHRSSKPGNAGSSPAGGAICPRSSEDERHAPNVEDAGSNPAGGAKSFLKSLIEDKGMTVARLRTHMLVDEETAELFVEAGVITEQQLQDARERLKEDPMGRLKPGRLKRKGA